MGGGGFCCACTGGEVFEKYRARNVHDTRYSSIIRGCRDISFLPPISLGEDDDDDDDHSTLLLTMLCVNLFHALLPPVGVTTLELQLISCSALR